MKRKRHRRLPDAINCSITKNFTQIPNEMLKNPNISGKAKTILSILLSNKDGWVSHIQTLNNFMKEGLTAIQSGLKELEEHQYLKRIKYRNKKTKSWAGSLWAYTDVPGVFNIKDHYTLLLKEGYELNGMENPDMENPDMENPDMENPDMDCLLYTSDAADE